MKADTKEQILAGESVAEDLDTIRASESAPEIIACARRHLNRPQVMQAAYNALEALWPGFFSCSNALRRSLSEVDTKRRLESADLRLVPATHDEMEEGTTYLAATFGVSGVVAVVIQGTSNPELAAQYAKVFRIEPKECTGKVAEPAPRPDHSAPTSTQPDLFS